MNDVSGQGQCSVKVNAQYVKLKTAEFYEDLEIPMTTSSTYKGSTLIIKIDEKLREMLDMLETEVKKKLPKGFLYKALYQGQTMCIKVSRFCKYFLYDENCKITRLITPGNTAFKQGHYVYMIRVPYLFVGMHRNGEQCSLTLDVDEIFYKPDYAAMERDRLESSLDRNQFFHTFSL